MLDAKNVSSEGGQGIHGKDGTVNWPSAKGGIGMSLATPDNPKDAWTKPKGRLDRTCEPPIRHPFA